jgi:hypothetical protein
VLQGCTTAGAFAIPFASALDLSREFTVHFQVQQSAEILIEHCILDVWESFNV